MSGNQQILCFSVTIHKLTGYLRFTVYPQHINFSMEDNDFIDLVHNRRVTFEYETSINCDLKIVERKVGNKPATYSYTVLRVHSYLDATHLEENGRRYTRVDHLRDDD
jgi:hypothetical protein